MADLTKLSDADLVALKSGDLTKVSDEGLMLLKGGKPTADSPVIDRVFDSLKSGTKSVIEGVGNFEAGKLRGAASIGSTIMRVLPNALGGDTAEENKARRSSIDDALRQFGADTESVPYGVGKLGAEIAGTAGAGPALAVGAKVLPVVSNSQRLIQALQSAGMTTGAKAVPGIGTAAADLGIRTGAGAVAGGAQAAMVDPQQAETGAAVGAALPTALKAFGKAGQFLGQTFTKSGATRNAADKITEAAGGDANQIAADINTYFPKGAENIPLSVAAITKNPAVAQLEQGSRLKVTEPWFNFDQKQGKAVYDNVIDATKEAEKIAERAQIRRDNWKEAWQKATEAEKPRIWKREMSEFRRNLDIAAESAESSNPAVKAAVDQVRAEMNRLGDRFTPSHLQQLRAELNGKVNPMSGTLTLKTAPRDNPAIISLKNELDRILSASTGGKWERVLEGYAADSAALNESRAAEKVRSRFVDRDSGRVLGRALDPAGEVPVITEAGLGGALNQARAGDKTMALSGDAADQLQATIDALRRQGIVQTTKRSASAGGGSDTVSNALSVAAGSQGTGGSMAVLLAKALKAVSTSKTDKEMANLLSNPDELAKALGALQAKRALPNPAASIYRAAPALVGDQ